MNVDLGELRRSIRHIELSMARSRRLDRLLKGAIACGVGLLVAAVVANFVLGQTFGRLAFNILFGILFGAVVICLIAILSRRNSVYRDPKELEIELDSRMTEYALASDRSGQDLFDRQLSYRAMMTRELEVLRNEGKKYRTINNAMQSVIIVGSLATTTVASLAQAGSSLQWLTVTLSFFVGVSAGMAGFFKFRERGFYLQQTADDIERNLKAYDLGLSPYGIGREVDLSRLTQEVEILRVEQQKRQQQLDQPRRADQEGA